MSELMEALAALRKDIKNDSSEMLVSLEGSVKSMGEAMRIQNEKVDARFVTIERRLKKIAVLEAEFKNIKSIAVSGSSTGLESNSTSGVSSAFSVGSRDSNGESPAKAHRTHSVPARRVAHFGSGNGGQQDDVVMNDGHSVVAGDINRGMRGAVMDGRNRFRTLYH